MANKNILIVHPYDKTTVFLEGIISHLQASFGAEVECFKIQTNDNSHNLCVDRIKVHPSNGVIIFLGHGRSDALYGSKGDDYSPSLGFEEISAFPDLYFFKESFITKNNADVFSGKKIFCLACNSNSKIAGFAIQSGAETFLGFGDIPTSPDEFKIDGNSDVSNSLVSKMKSELNYIIKKSLEYSISKSYSFEQLHNIIKFIVNQRITEILITQKDFSERYILTDYLYYLKKDIIIFGNKKIKVMH